MTKFKLVFLSIVIASVVGMMSMTAAAQPNPNQTDTDNARNNPCSDPWVSIAVSVAKTVPGSQTPGRADGSGNTGECDTSHYNNGQWNSYAELLGYVRARLGSSNPSKPAGFSGQCNDGWINDAVKEVTGQLPQGQGTEGQCDPSLYNHASWSSYPELLGYVRHFYGYEKQMNKNGIFFVGSFHGNDDHQYVVVKKDDIVVGLDVGIVAQGGGNVVAAGGGNIVAQGGGNVVGPAGGSIGGSLVSTNGGNIVAQGGGNFKVVGTAQLVAAGGGNVVAAGGGNVVAAGGGNVVAAGGGNLVAAGGGNVVSQGGGNFRERILQDTGQTLFQFPDKYAVISTAQQTGYPQRTAERTTGTPQRQVQSQPQRTTERTTGTTQRQPQSQPRQVQSQPQSSNPTPPPTNRNNEILTCINRPNGQVKQLLGSNQGKNHITVSLNGDIAYFSGTVVSESYKWGLTIDAKNCGARDGNTDNLRVSR